MLHRIAFTSFFSLVALLSAQAADSAKPLRALLITGGCCHNYTFQSQALTNGVAKTGIKYHKEIRTNDPHQCMMRRNGTAQALGLAVALGRCAYAVMRCRAIAFHRSNMFWRCVVACGRYQAGGSLPDEALSASQLRARHGINSNNKGNAAHARRQCSCAEVAP